MHRLFFIGLIASLVLFKDDTNAVDCTDQEALAITDAYMTTVSTSECSPYSSISDLLITVMPPCSATECVSIVKQMAESIPNCTTGAYTKKDLLLQSLDMCVTPEPTPASTASTTNCTSEQAEATFNAFYEAANGSCADSTNIEAYSITIDTQCNSTCAATVQTFAQSLPNCNYELSGENTNKKQDIATQFSYCKMLDNTTNISVYADSVDNLLGSSAGTTTIEPNCTTEEIEETVAFYHAIANNESCAHDTSVCAYDIHISTACDTECGRLVRRLGLDVPRCYFGHVNYRQVLSESWYQCEWDLNPVNISTSFHYSEILNVTGNLSVGCDPKFDSTVNLDDGNSLGSNSTPVDNSAAKPYQDFILWSLVVVVLAIDL